MSGTPYNNSVYGCLSTELVSNYNLSETEVDAVDDAMVAVFAAQNSLKCYAFAQDPSAASVGFSAVSTAAAKGFYRKYNITTSEGAVTPGSYGGETNGSVTFAVESETTYWGTCPKGNYTIKYVDDTMAALVSAGTSEANWGKFVTGLFAILAANPGTKIYTNMMYFRLSATTGSLSASGTDYKELYIPPDS